MKKIILFLSILISLSLFYYGKQLTSEKAIEDCFVQLFSKNNIHGISIEFKKNRAILTGQVNKTTRKKIHQLIYNQCGENEPISEITLRGNNLKPIAWILFEVDNVNQLISIHGEMKNQLQREEVLTLFANNFPNKTLTHDVSLNVLIKRKNTLINHLTYLLPSIKKIQGAKIKLTENKLFINGLVRNQASEALIVNQLKQIFTTEITIENNLERVIKENNKIESLEFSLPKIPPLSKK